MLWVNFHVYCFIIYHSVVHCYVTPIFLTGQFNSFCVGVVANLYSLHTLVVTPACVHKRQLTTGSIF